MQVPLGHLQHLIRSDGLDTSQVEVEPIGRQPVDGILQLLADDLAGVLELEHERIDFVVLRQLDVLCGDRVRRHRADNVAHQ